MAKDAYQLEWGLTGKEDLSSFKAIFDQNFRPLCFYAFRIVQSMEDAEDIVMDVFTRLWQSNNQLQGIIDVSAFLFTSVKNASLDHRKKQERSLRSLPFSVNDGSVYEASSLEAEEIYARLLQEIHVHIDNLPEQCRLIFKMIFFDRKSTSEIAHSLGLSVQSVRNQKTRALQLLKLRLSTSSFLLFIAILNSY